jgi:hypothetical protein
VNKSGHTNFRGALMIPPFLPNFSPSQIGCIFRSFGRASRRMGMPISMITQGRGKARNIEDVQTVVILHTKHQK